MVKSNPKIKLDIVYKDSNIVVIEKPAGVLTHPVRESQNNTIANGFLAYCPEAGGVGDSLRPGIVHRLDKETSGLLILAKNQKSFGYFKKQFKERKMEKHYLALVVGRIKDDTGIIAKSISSSKKDYKKRSALLDTKAKSALTRYKVLKRFENYTLIEAQIETGRTHQIRVHLASIGHPLAGDRQYKFKRQPCPEDLSRQFLHASYLKFRLPNGRILKLKSELPSDLKKIIEELQ